MPPQKPSIRQITLILCLVSAALLYFLSQAAAALSDHVSEATLPNGLKVILAENHKVPLVSFQIWYRVGSRNEESGKTGLSHMLEHMMFKGTEKIGSEEFSRIVAQNGGNDNAFTSRDFTAYFENISSDRVGVPIELESDRMHGLLLREEDFKTERSVVMEERRMRTDDNPKALLSEQLSAAAFLVQPYRWPVIGWMQDIARYTVEDLKAYYGTYYLPVNAFIVVAGDFKKEDLMPRIEKAFGGIRPGTAPDQRRDREDRQLGERRLVVRKEAQIASVEKAYHVPNLKEPDSYVLEVIAALLSSGESSRLQRSLVRQKHLALSVSADNELVSKDPNLFSVSADVLPGVDADEVEKALVSEIELLQKGVVDERELEKAKNQLEAAFVFAQDSLFAQGMILATYEIASSWRDADRYVPRVRAVSAADIQRVARKYLASDNCISARLVPIPSARPMPVEPGAAAKGQILRQR